MSEAERLAATLESDANDHRAIAQSVDGKPEHTANWQHMLTAEEAAAELRRLEAECEQLRQALADLGVTPDEAKAGVERSRANRLDAARYRWMKQWVVQIPPGWERIGWDAAIDAAMKEAKAHGWTFSKEAAAAMKETK